MIIDVMKIMIIKQVRDSTL